MTRQYGGYAIGTRRRAAMRIKRNNEAAEKQEWRRHIPDDPRELVRMLRESGVDMDELRKALR